MKRPAGKATFRKAIAKIFALRVWALACGLFAWVGVCGQPLVTSMHPLHDTSLCAGAALRVDVVSNSSNPPMHWRWEVRRANGGAWVPANSNAFLGYQSASLQTIAADSLDGFVVRCIVGDATPAVDTSDTVRLHVHALPMVSVGADRGLCRGDSTILYASVVGGGAPFTFQWQPGGTGDSLVIHPNLSQTYQCHVADVHHCLAADTLTVTVWAPPVAMAGPDTSICLGNGLMLTAAVSGAAPPFQYAWQGGGQQPYLVVAPPVSTAFVVVVTDSHHCAAADTVHVTVHFPPQVVAGADRSICRGDSLVLAASILGGLGPYQVDWLPGGAGVQVHLALLQTQQVRVLVTDAHGCSARDTVAVTVHTPPVADAGADEAICAGNSLVHIGTANGAGGPFAFQWLPSGQIGTSLHLLATQDQTITLVVTDAHGCQGRDTLLLSVSPRPQPQLVGAQVVCGNASQVPYAAQPALVSQHDFLWSSTGGGSFEGNASGAMARYHFPAGPSWVQIAVTELDIASGCADSSAMLVEVMADQSPNPASFFILAPNILVCRDTTVDYYEWGFDSLGTSVPLLTGQQAFVVVPHFDTLRYQYWVITSYDANGQGCRTKTYYGGIVGAIAPLPPSTGVSLFPNPAHAATTLIWEGLRGCQYALYAFSMSGQAFMLGSGVQVLGSNVLKLDLGGMPSGLYRLQLRLATGEVANLKLVIQGLE